MMSIADYTESLSALVDTQNKQEFKNTGCFKGLLNEYYSSVIFLQGEPKAVLHHGCQGAAGLQGDRGGNEAFVLNLPGLC